MLAGIALIPDSRFINHVVSMQRQLMELMTVRPMLSATGNLPHVTLIQNLHLDDNGIEEKLHAIYRQICEYPRGIVFRIWRAVYVERGWCFLDLSPDASLHSLHRKTFSMTKTMLRSPMSPDSGRMATYSETEKQSYLKYGYRYIGDSNRPHVTIGRIPAAEKSRALAFIEEYLQMISNFRL
jgi:hypothetical protein